MPQESDSKPDKPKPIDSSDQKTPAEWARACGQVRKAVVEQTFSTLNGKIFDQIGSFHWEHEAAAVLHGWALHEHHAGKPIALSRADYEAALKAAGTTDQRGEYQPHKPALSPHKGA